MLSSITSSIRSSRLSEQTDDSLQPATRPPAGGENADAKMLLPFVQPGPVGEAGAADKKVQAYNFRLCMTDSEENQVPFPKPPGYEPKRYELLARYLARRLLDDLKRHHGFVPEVLRVEVEENVGQSATYEWRVG